MTQSNSDADSSRPVYQNPVFPRYFADPFVWRAEGAYFAVGTSGPEAAESNPQPGQPQIFSLLRSTDLVHWQDLGAALVPPPAEAGTDFWAPEVACENGRYYMYYSVGFGDRAHHLRVAVSDSPAGPYIDNGQPLTTPQSCPFAIDAHAFRDDDGQWYLFSARDFLERDAQGEAGTGLVVERLVDMTRLEGNPRLVLRARYPWQLYQASRPIYDRILDWHTLEGPSVLKHAGRYYCFFSAGNWQNDSYGVDYAVADSPLGPWRYEGGENGARILRTRPGSGLIGPGHNSFVTGPDGRTWIVYHAWDEQHTARRMCIDPIGWTDDGVPFVEKA